MERAFGCAGLFLAWRDVGQSQILRDLLDKCRQHALHFAAIGSDTHAHILIGQVVRDQVAHRRIVIDGKNVCRATELRAESAWTFRNSITKVGPCTR